MWTTDRYRAAAAIAEHYPEWADQAAVAVEWATTPTDDQSKVRAFLDGFAFGSLKNCTTRPVPDKEPTSTQPRPQRRHSDPAGNEFCVCRENEDGSRVDADPRRGRERDACSVRVPQAVALMFWSDVRCFDEAARRPGDLDRGSEWRRPSVGAAVVCVLGGVADLGVSGQRRRGLISGVPRLHRGVARAGRVDGVGARLLLRG
jgi:hypothetical protein